MKRRRLFHLGLWGPQVNQGVDWEIEHHLEEHMDELRARGLSAAEAEREARRAFGDVQHVRRELRGIDRGVARRAWFAQVLETVLQDVRYGLRGVRRNPAFSLGVVLTLGLGLGASVALFSVIDALLLRPLPYRAPGELVQVEIMDSKSAVGHRYLRRPQMLDFLARQDLFRQSFVHKRGNELYLGGTEARSLSVQRVGSEFEETLGVGPLLGRGLLPEDTLPGAAPVAVLNHGFWRTELGADQAILGKTIELNGVRYQVVGVMPPGFKFPEYASTEAWLPLVDDGTLGRQPLELVGRLSGIPIEAANPRVISLSKAIFKEHDPASDQFFRLIHLGDLRARNASLRESIWLLAGAVFAILLVAGVNVINLLLVRATTRTREIAVRLALGASRLRLLRQLATESLTLALLAGVLAVGIAILTLRSIAGIMPGSITFFAPYEIAVEQRALVFAFGLTVLSGLVLGLGPALSALRNVRTAGEDVSRYAARTRGKHRVRNILVASEVALSVTLLIGGGLLLNSFIRLQRVDPGFRMDNLAVLTQTLSSSTFPTAAQRSEYARQLKQRLEALPGVQAVSITGGLPPTAGMFMSGFSFEVPGQEPRPQPPGMLMPVTDVRPDFFEVTGARLLAGRAFNETDSPENGNVIIDEDLAHYLWPDQSPLGQRFRVRSEQPWYTVVGVMADLKLMGPDDRKIRYELLTPLKEIDWGYLALAIRTNGNPRPLLASIRATVHEVNPNQPIWELAPATVLYADSIDLPRFLMVLVTALAALALTLAAIGIFGVLAYVVNQKQHEFGIRLALGARAEDLRRLIVRQGFLLALAGAAAGLAGALVLTRFIRGTLYGVQPNDPLTLTVVVVTMLGVALAACVQPARRATTLDPASVLRSE